MLSEQELHNLLKNLVYLRDILLQPYPNCYLPTIMNQGIAMQLQGSYPLCALASANYAQFGQHDLISLREMFFTADSLYIDQADTVLFAELEPLRSVIGDFNIAVIQKCLESCGYKLEWMKQEEMENSRDLVAQLHGHQDLSFLVKISRRHHFLIIRYHNDTLSKLDSLSQRVIPCKITDVFEFFREEISTPASAVIKISRLNCSNEAQADTAEEISTNSLEVNQTNFSQVAISSDKEDFLFEPLELPSSPHEFFANTFDDSQLNSIVLCDVTIHDMLTLNLG